MVGAGCVRVHALDVCCGPRRPLYVLRREGGAPASPPAPSSPPSTPRTRLRVASSVDGLRRPVLSAPFPRTVFPSVDSCSLTPRSGLAQSPLNPNPGRVWVLVLVLVVFAFARPPHPQASRPVCTDVWKPLSICDRLSLSSPLSKKQRSPLLVVVPPTRECAIPAREGAPYLSAWSGGGSEGGSARAAWEGGGGSAPGCSRLQRGCCPPLPSPSRFPTSTPPFIGAVGSFYASDRPAHTRPVQAKGCGLPAHTSTAATTITGEEEGSSGETVWAQKHGTHVLPAFDVIAGETGTEESRIEY